MATRRRVHGERTPSIFPRRSLTRRGARGALAAKGHEVRTGTPMFNFKIVR